MSASETTKLKAAILVISDTAFADNSTDKVGAALRSVFSEARHAEWEVSEFAIIADDVLQIQKYITKWCDGEQWPNLIATSGGTGFAVRDCTPEVSV